MDLMSGHDITRPGAIAPHIPDDLTIPQFLLDSFHPTRPIPKETKPWLIDDDTGKALGYFEVRGRTYGLANELHARWNIGENDVVCIYSPNHIEYPIVIWAAHRLGSIVTTANPAYTTDELEHQLNITKASLLITHSGNLSTATAAASKCGISPDRIIIIDDGTSVSGPQLTIPRLITDGLAKISTFTERRLVPGEAKTKIAFYLLSSGTTGTPKAVLISHYAAIANTILPASSYKVNEEYAPHDEQKFRVGDIVLCELPLFHAYGLITLLHLYLYCGMSVVVVPKFNFVGMLKSIERFRVNHLLLVPPMVVLLCKSPAVKQYDLSSVRSCLCGAAPMSAEITQQLIKIIPQADIGQGYGMTETCSSLTWPRLDQKIGTLGSAGQLLPGIRARVIKSDGTLAQFGEPGELFVQGPVVCLGYLDNEKATIRGWLRSGDQVIMNELAEVFVVDRLKEFLKVKGFQVAPAELEGHLLDHPDISETCVIGIPDDYSGEVPVAFVVPNQAAQERIKTSPAEADRIKISIAKHVADAKAPYKWLAGGVEFVDTIPKTPSGKLLRRVMREQAKALRRKTGVKL